MKRSFYTELTLVVLATAAAIIINFISCDSAFRFSPLDKFTDASFEGVGNPPPNELVPSSENSGILVPGSNMPNDGYVPPSAQGGEDDCNTTNSCTTTTTTTAQVTTTTTTLTETPTPTPTPTNPPGCKDINDRYLYLCVYSEGVSSAYAKLNGDIIFGQNSFHNKDFMACRRIVPKKIGNVLDLWIAGKPGDSMIMAVYEADILDGRFDPNYIFETELIRSKGKPIEKSYQFDIPESPTCEK